MLPLGPEDEEKVVIIVTFSPLHRTCRGMTHWPNHILDDDVGCHPLNQAEGHCTIDRLAQNA